VDRGDLQSIPNMSATQMGLGDIVSTFKMGTMKKVGARPIVVAQSTLRSKVGGRACKCKVGAKTCTTQRCQCVVSGRKCNLACHPSHNKCANC